MTNAWQTTRGSGVTIAVLDTGVNPAQADLTGSVTTGPDYTNSGRPAGGPFWGIHGTELASLIAGHGHGPGQANGIIGIAPAAKILSLRVTLESYDPRLSDQAIAAGLPDAIARGISWAVGHKASVIDLPLDPVTTPGAAGSGGSAAERAAVDYAIDKHVVLVAPAGDGGAGTNPVNYPAAYDGVISVGAFDQHFVKAPFSSHRGYVTVTAAGAGVTAAGPSGTYLQLNSTSAASAMVAGTAALIRAQFPSLTPSQVIRAITSSTVFRRHGGRAGGSGYGAVDAAKALFAAAAIAEAVPSSAASGTGSGQAAPSPPAVHSGPIHRNIRGTLIGDAIIAGLFFLLLLGLIFGVKAWRRRHARSARLAEVRAAAQIPVRKPGQATAKKASPAKGKAAKAKAAKAKAGKGGAKKAAPAGGLVPAGVGAPAGEAAEPELEPAGFIPAPLSPAAGGPGGSGFTGSASGFTGSASGFTGSASGFTGSASGFTGSAALTGSAAGFTGSASPAFTGSASGFTGSASGFTGSASGFAGSASGFTGSAASGVAAGDPSSPDAGAGGSSPGVAAGDPSSPGLTAGGTSPGFTAAGRSSPGLGATSLGPAGASSPSVPGPAAPAAKPGASPADVVPPADLTSPDGPGTSTPPWARMQSEPGGLAREGAGAAIPDSAFPGGASPSGAFVSAPPPAPTGEASSGPEPAAGTTDDGPGLSRMGTRLTQGPRQPRTPQVSGRPPWDPAPEPDSELPWVQAPMPPRSGAESLPRRAQARPELASWDELAQTVWPGGPKVAGPHPAVPSPAEPNGRPGLAATGQAVPAAGPVRAQPDPAGRAWPTRDRPDYRWNPAAAVEPFRAARAETAAAGSADGPPAASPGASATPSEGSASSATGAVADSQPGVSPARRPSLALPRRIGSSLARQAGSGRGANPVGEGPTGAGLAGGSFTGAGSTGTGSSDAGWAGTGTGQPSFPPAPRPATDLGLPDAGQPEKGPFPGAIKPPTDPGAPGARAAGVGASGADRDGPALAPWASRPAAESGPPNASQPEAGAPRGSTEGAGLAESGESFPALHSGAVGGSFPRANPGDSTESFPPVRPRPDMEDAFRLFPPPRGTDNEPPAADGED